MSGDLEEEYPEAAPFIRDAVEEHGEGWVIENYVPKIASLGVLMDVPSVEELPFYDEERHETLTMQKTRASRRVPEVPGESPERR